MLSLSTGVELPSLTLYSANGKLPERVPLITTEFIRSGFPENDLKLSTVFGSGVLSEVRDGAGANSRSILVEA